MTNAFTIPAKSSVVEGNRTFFPSVRKSVHQNMRPITLPGSSPYPPPQMMRKATNENTSRG